MLSADWTYTAFPTTEMFCMPFTGQVGLTRKALGSIHRHIPDVEKILRKGGYQAPNSLIRLPSWSQTSSAVQEKVTNRIRTGTR